MFYKPTYCCHCGEKIENTENLPRFGSGRFCDVCRREFSFEEWMPRVFIGICLVVGLFGVGGFLQGTQTTQTAALKQSRTLMPIAPASSDDRKTQVTDEHRRMTQTGDPKVVPNRDAVESDGTGERQTSGTEPSRVEKTYYCGAATKKGTACSRKVKGGGRCWQHKGQEALLAPDKLLISQ